MADYTKQRIALRYWLLGRESYAALEAMRLAESLHTGTRKDGVTPEFAHQVAVASYLRTLAPGLRFPDETFAAGLLHDASEDYDLSLDVVEAACGRRVRDAVWRLTKVFLGVKKPMEEYFAEIATDPIASVVKGADRIHNQSSMTGVFTRLKQGEYMEETERYILPMVKTARRNFPAQEPVYENIKLVLESQISLLRLSGE